MFSAITIVVVLAQLASQKVAPDANCIREQIVVRTTDNTEFSVVEVPSGVTITDITAKARYQLRNDDPVRKLKVGVELPIGSMLYLYRASKVVGTCGDIQCLDIQTHRQKRNFILFLPQCPTNGA